MKTTNVKPPSDEIVLTTSGTLETRGVNRAIPVMTFIVFVSKRLELVGIN